MKTSIETEASEAEQRKREGKDVLESSIPPLLTTRAGVSSQAQVRYAVVVSSQPRGRRDLGAPLTSPHATFHPSTGVTAGNISFGLCLAESSYVAS